MPVIFCNASNFLLHFGPSWKTQGCVGDVLGDRFSGCFPSLNERPHYPIAPETMTHQHKKYLFATFIDSDSDNTAFFIKVEVGHRISCSQDLKNWAQHPAHHPNCEYGLRNVWAWKWWTFSSSNLVLTAWKSLELWDDFTFWWLPLGWFCFMAKCISTHVEDGRGVRKLENQELG